MRILVGLAAALVVLAAAPGGRAADIERDAVPDSASIQPSAGGAPRSRPRIGLVLGGGGAKGAAHVGVLAVLDELHVPIDCIVGTSMGALVGGTLASGMSAPEVEAATRSIPWADTLAFRGYREKLPIRRKLAGVTYSNSLTFGIKEGGITAPRGFINSQNVEQTIKFLVSRSLGENDFDHLPIPFRAIATDMQSGDMVVLAKGDLAQAMRASMSVPGIFAPVTIDGRLLGDGGLTRNLPVDVARQTCADVVIAVSVPNPPPTPEELQSPLTLAARTIDVLVGANEKQQLDTLGPADVKVVVPMGDVGAGSFDRIAETIPLGRAAAEQHRAELARYSLPEADYLAWRAAHTRPEVRSVQLADVRIVGLHRVSRDYTLAKLGLRPGQQVDQYQLSKAMDRLFALDDYDSVQYQLLGDPDHPTLEVHVTEKSASPDILRFDVGLLVGTDSNSAFSLGGDYLRPWVNDLGGEVHGKLQIGRTAAAGLSLYQPLDAGHVWFIEPGLYARRSVEDFFVDGEAVSRYSLEEAYGFLDAGRNLGTRAELRVGVRAGVQGATRSIAVPELPDPGNESYGGVSLGFTYDDRDNAALATRGWLGRLDYYRSMQALGAASNYDRLDAMLVKSVPVGGNLLVMRATGGTTLEGELPVSEYFTLGGPVSLPGLSLGELRGTSYWSGSATWLHKVAEISELFGQSLYLGARLTAADVAGRLDEVRSAPIYSGALLLGGRTPLGPLTLELGVTTTDDWQVTFALGRPIEERSITDPIW